MSESLGEDALLTLGLSSNNTSISNQKGEDDVASACYVRSDVDSNVSRLFLDHEDGRNAGLVGLLFEAAAAVETRDMSSAFDTLQEIHRFSSLMDDPIQRVVAYFSDALAEIFYPPRPPFGGSMNRICPSQEEEFSAFMEFYRVLPFYQFAHFTANQEIIEAFEEEEAINGGRIHVIDFDVSYGFQWPSLIQSLSDMATTSREISLTLTGYGRNADELTITKERLESFANGCPNLSFQFEGILRGSDVIMSTDFRSNSTLVVNMPFYLQALKSSQEINHTLAYVYSMNPSLVILVEKERYRKARSFLPKFTESLYFYMAIFDSLHELLPLESVERLNIEKNYLGKEIKREIGDQGQIEETDRDGHDEKPWKETMRGLGFEGKQMSFRSLRQAKLLLNMKSPCRTIDGTNFGFDAFERDYGCEIALSWRDRVLVFVSCWRRSSPRMLLP